MVVKRQHYILRFYLKGFADEGRKLFALRRDQIAFGPTNVNDACVEKYLYEVRCGDSRFVETGAVEGWLSAMERLISVLESMDIALLKAPSMIDLVTSSYPLEMGWEDADNDPSEVYSLQRYSNTIYTWQRQWAVKVRPSKRR